MSLWFALTRNLLLVRKRSDARVATAANERQAGGQDHRSRRRERRERGSPRVVQRCHEPQRRFLAAQQLGAERIIAFSRHADRQALARKIGATDIVEERGDAGVEKVKGADRWPGRAQRDRGRWHPGSHAAGHPSWTRAGGHVGFVGVSHDVPIPGDELFMGGVHIHGGPAPVRRFLPELIRLIWDRKIDAGKVFHLTLPLDRVAEKQMKIQITIGNQRLQATIFDSAAGRDLIAQLPLTIDMVDHGAVEKTGPLPSPLSLAGQPDGADPDVGDVGYYAPGNHLVFYYGDQSYYPGIVIIGRLDGDAASRIADMQGAITATVEAHAD
jgi:hypothetical protein